MVFALGTPMLIGAAAFTVETSYDYWKHTHLQAVADAAAYAGALELRSGASDSDVEAAALKGATENGWAETGNTIEVNTPPTSGAYTNDHAVEVKISENVPRFFTAMFIPTPVVAKARSVAVYGDGAKACILALDPTAPRAIEVQGNANVTLNNCDIASNSKDKDESLFAWGSSSLTAQCVRASGGIASKGNITVKGCKSPVSNAPRIADPFKKLETPSKGPTQQDTSKVNQSTTLHAGYYPNGISPKGNVTLESGVYYLGGDFKVNGSTTVSGDGVTIFMESGSTVTINGNGSVNLSAPTSGDYSGILFFGDRDGDSGDTQVFNGTSNLKLTGKLYFPTQTVKFQGNTGGTGGCTYVIADMVVMTGDAKLGVDCPVDPTYPQSNQYVKIVE